MPFTPVNTLPPSPLLTLYFKGLLVIQHLNDNLCEIGVHHDRLTTDPNKHHILKMNLQINLPGGGTIKTPIHAGPLERDHFNIHVPRAIKPGVHAYHEKPEFSRNTGTDNGRDLRWAINLEGDEFHREVLKKVLPEIQPSVMVDSGVFYTAERTDQNTVIIHRRRTGSYLMSSIAGVVGVAIDVVPGYGVEISWYKGGNRTLSLPRQGDPASTTYELTISNRPLADQTVDSDELAHYYEVLTEMSGSSIPDDEKWHLDIELESDFFEKGANIFKTDEIPCMPVLLDGVV
jgi:hypothetical protein